jgi:hypothetical protein
VQKAQQEIQIRQKSYMKYKMLQIVSKWSSHNKMWFKGEPSGKWWMCEANKK